MTQRFAGRPEADLAYPRQVARTRDFTSGRPRTFTVSPDGSRVVFLRSHAGDDPTLCLWVLDVTTGAERVIFDPRDAPGDEVELTPAERARRERMRERSTGVVDYACDREVTRAVFVESGRLLVADLLEGGARTIEIEGGVPDDPRLSPDGAEVAYVLHGAVWVRSVDAGRDPARRLTPEEPEDVGWGLAEFAAAEELGRRRGYWWAPDGAAIAAARVDERPVQVWWITDPTDPAAEPIRSRYPRVGTANAIVTLHVIDVATGAIREVAWEDRDRFEYLTRVDWDEHGLTFEVVARDFSASRIWVADPATGAATPVAEEIAEAWIEPIDGLPARLGDGGLVTSGPLDGVRAVLVDGDPVSPPGFHLAAVLDTSDDLIWCTSSYGDPTQDHVWTVGPHREAARITSDHGVHAAKVGGPTTVIVSRLEDRPGARVVVHAGERTVEIATHTEEPLVTPATRYLRLGERGLPAALHLPGGVDPAGSVPVLVASYGGPGFREVIRWQGMFHEHQFLADRLGVAVLSIDGRGTPGHDLAWEHAIAHDFSLTLDDQIAGLQAAAETLGFLDLDRVAFRGWSFGGELASLAVLKRPDVFHAAVAGAPVTDQRLYDTAYAERFLGHPDTYPDAYRISSPLTYVDGASPHRPLLLIHGLADDNVFAANTLQLSAALFARGYHHDLVLLPNASHIGGFDELVVARFVAELDFLRRALELEIPVTGRPSAPQVADRALVLYALARRASIELALAELRDDPLRFAQAERARAETDRWLERESLGSAVLEKEAELLAAPSGTWPREAVVDGLWRRESLAVLLWAGGHVDLLPAFGDEADPHVLDDAITRHGSVGAFRKQTWLRPQAELDRAFQESDAWFGATEGREGNDATLASISAERVRALSWLRDGDAAPA